ncbi:MAG: DUF4286 family protein [Rubricoccaceae bacterium]|nr:DUF4286 family protein [Rubricoccaceae bacterium]
MILYEVNLLVDAEIADDYAAWLGPHIKEILKLNGFLSAEWFEVETEDKKHIHWCIHYRLKDRTSLETYFIEHADRMRGDGLNRFSGRFTADRRILGRVSSIGGEIRLN